jgi:replicative DNA helicase
MHGLPRIGLADPVVADGWGGPRHSTGLAALDERVGGLAAGELWVLTGTPGQGRSSLLAQVAAAFACDHALSTWLISNRDPAPVVAGRLLSRAGLGPLNHIADDRLTVEDRDRLEGARDRLEAAPLRVFAGRGAADYWLAEHAESSVTESCAALFDDPDWEGAWDLRQARRLADSGWAVVVSLPRPRVLDGPAHRSDLHDEIALADIVIEVRVSNLGAVEAYPRVDEPGYAALTVLPNRRGPGGTAVVQFQGHYARFVDEAPRGRVSWEPA